MNMLWCPLCRKEYREGISQCPTCGAALVNRLPPTDGGRQKPPVAAQDGFSQEPLEPRLLISCEDKIPAGLVEGLLRNEHIPFFTKDSGGHYPKTYRGYSSCSQNIYVNSRDYAHAREFIDAYVHFDRDDDAPPTERAQRAARRRKTATRILIILALLFPVALGIAGVLFNRFS